MKNQTQIIYNLVLVVFALVGVIVVLVLYIIGAPTSTLEPVAPVALPEPEPEPQPEPQPIQEQEPQPTPPPSQPESVSPPPPTQQPAQPTEPFNDKDCGDFQTHAQAQAFFESQGGPAQDPHKLDRNKDGVVCESLL